MTLPATFPTHLAHHAVDGAGPTILFLPGYASDMTGGKALALEGWARGNGQGFVRFDYSGCGASPGAFEEQTLVTWRDDAIAMIDAISGPVLLVGSSMGGWIMLLAALARPSRVVAMVGIAAAPDFTDWGFTVEEKVTLMGAGRIERPSDPGTPPMVTTRGFWSSGEANRVLHGWIDFKGPVRLLHGQKDAVVPWERSLRLAELLRSGDVQTILVKDGDHRLSREEDLALLLRTVEEVTASL
jgi:pimeloyl-ACP methyl ester carboxylesterase